MKPIAKHYHTPLGWTCPNCHEEAQIISNRNDYSDEYGICYPPGWGEPICSNCEHPIEDAEEERL